MEARRRNKLTIVGAGAVGSSLAYAALMRGVARNVVLYDVNGSKARAEALDLEHGSEFMPTARVEGSNDPEITRNSDVVVITAGAKQKPGESRMDLAASTVELMKKVIPPMVERSPEALFLMVTNPVDVTTYAALKISGLPRNQLFGSGTVLDSARLRVLVAQHCGVAIGNVHAYICGEHGDSEIPLWSSATIGGVPLLKWELQTGRLGESVRDDMADRVVNAAYEVIAGKGATNYGIGVSGTRIIEAMFNDEHRVLPVSSLLEGWHGISDVCMSVPTIVDRLGVGMTLEMPLQDGELGCMHDSAEVIRSTLRRIGF
ncbi:L-lactate dehydrogenase [Tessaracoccus antarcticus]|uniref:L-lactate dehydrogenase n=1 Tax=Tessaracoccus antarcticus TaxID=2479848 RepID=A0A3M0GAY2_9ACTN|nr:L-lactate dehydrogenase [Tessaracoccus antarcticus]RMB62175.1 L-lactate dehydrogenase [Tessaracoccus antarcticus]